MSRETIRVGVPQELDDSLRHFFPAGAELIRVPDEPVAPVDVEFWIPPYMTKTITHVYDEDHHPRAAVHARREGGASALGRRGRDHS